MARNSSWSLTPERALLAVSTVLLAVLTYLAQDLLERVKRGEARDLASEIRDAEFSGDLKTLSKTVDRIEAEQMRQRDMLDRR